MLEYLLKSAACMAVFLLFYQFLLEKERMHHFKRFFLLGALLASLIIPALVFTEYVEAVPSTLAPQTSSYASPEVIPANEPVTDMDVINWSLITWTLYGIGVFLIGLRFVKHLYQILQRIRKNPKLKLRAITQVLLKEKMPPHTFFSFIFLNKEALEKKEIPNEVLIHEETHAKQFHSLDVLFIELLQVILWFNPLLLVFKKNIKLNHEFLADGAVLKENVPTKSYQNTLLSFLSAASERKYQSVRMANAINYSSIKKRFTIMKKQTSKLSIATRTLLLIPLTILMLLGFSEKRIVQQKEDYTIGVTSSRATEKELLEYENLVKSHHLFIDFGIEPRQSEMERARQLYGLMNETQKSSALHLPDYSSLQKSASREQMKEYNALAKKYNEMPRNNMHILGKEVERMKYIFGIMSDKQKADAEPFPEFPEPPVPPEPTVVEKFHSVIATSPGTDETNQVRNVPPPPTSPMVEELNSVAPEFASPPQAPIEEVREIPPPPTPPSPLDHVIEMAKKGATFYYEGKKISSDKAIELLKKNKNLNIETTKTNSKNPQVKISKAPITIGKSSTAPTIETGNVTVDGKELFYSKKDGVTTYHNKNGELVDKEGQKLKDVPRTKPTFYFNEEQISSVRAHELLQNNTSIQVTTEDVTEGEYAIVLRDLNADTGNNYNRNINHNSLIDLTEMIAKGASFYYNNQPITTEKALRLTQNEDIERVQTVGNKNGALSVYFWKKV